MSDLTFEGALENLSEVQVKFVTDVLEKCGINNGKVFAEPVGKKGDNYTADVLRLTVESNDGDTLKMIAKIAPKIPLVRTMMSTDIAFGNEHAMYAEIFPKLTEQEEIASVPKNEKFKYPICYGSLVEPPNEIILLEDLQESNFVMLDRMQSLSNDSVKLVMKNLAKLHSFSYVLKHKNPEMYNNLKQKLVNPWIAPATAERFKDSHIQMEDDMLSIMDNEKYKNAVKGIANVMPDLATFSKLCADSKSSVIQQGDCWTNNIMFKLENGEPVQCIMIDYQISKETNPTVDLLHFILNCTDYDTRSKHYQEWIDCYHTALDDYLSYYGLKADRVYPRDQLEADLRRHGRLGLTISMMVASTLIRESKDAIDIKTDSDLINGDNKKASDKFRLIYMNKETLLRYKKKVEELVDSATEYGLI